MSPTSLPKVLVEKVSLSRATLDAFLQRSFSDHESINPQYGIDWLSNLAGTALDPDDRAVVFVARRSADEFVALPLKLHARHRSAQALRTFYTSAYAPVIHSGDPLPLFTALFRHLATVEKLGSLMLSPMSAEDTPFDLIQQALVQAGWRGVHRFFCFGNWIHRATGESYPKYLASRPSSLRNTVQRRTRKFLQQSGGGIEIIHGGEKLETAVEQYIAVYNNSWKREEPYPDFIPRLLHLAASRGWLRLGIASCEGVPVAAQIWLVSGGKAFIFKLAYDERYKSLSPGTVLTAHMMQHALDVDAVTAIDYLSGDDAYKADWMSERREQHGLAAFNPRSAAGLLLLASHYLKTLAKTLGSRGGKRRARDSGNPSAN